MTIEHELSAAVTARVEGYFKSFNQLIVGRLETPEETASRVATYDFPADLASNIPTAPQITSIPVNGATGEAYGFDIYVEKRPRAARDRLTGWISVHLGQGDDRRLRRSAAVRLRPPSFRQPGLHARRESAHRFQFDAAAGIGLRHDPPNRRAYRGRSGSGRSRTPCAGGGPCGPPCLDGGLRGCREPRTGRLPVFARLDMRVTFKSKNPNGRWEVYVEVLNALNRKNVSQLQPELLYDPSSDRPQIGYSSDSGLPRLPSFGLRLRF